MSRYNSIGNGSGHDSKRRRFLKVGGALGVGGAVGGVALTALFPKSGHTQMRHRRTPLQTNTAATWLTKFVDRLPIPSAITSNATLNGVPFYDVRMRPLQEKLHRDMSPTSLWGYNGLYPAPTFDVRRGHPIAVKWENNLPGSHFLPIDPTIHGAEPSTPTVRTVVHLHGMKTMPDSDGYPEAWFTNGFAKTGPFFETQVYHYPNDQQATTLWYHDHALGITRLNVYAGLGGGLYLIRDDHEDSLDLPSGRYEVPLVIQDRYFNHDGSLLYPVEDNGGDPDPRVPPIWIPEFFGDTVLVNGKVWPFLEVEPRKYRFRILNGSNARFYHMTLQEGTETDLSVSRPVSPPVFHQIGSDGGLLPAPVTRTDLLMAPAERVDVVIDFSGFKGRNFVLTNDGPAPYPGGGDVVPPVVMLFKVNQHLQGTDRSRLPATLNTIPLYNPASAVKTRDLVLSELDSADPFVNPIMAMINGAHWDDPVTENPKAGSIEIWRIINTTGDGHPIHVHLVQFQVLDRQPFNPDLYPNLVFTEPPSPPPAYERPAWKDTIVSLPGTVTRIIAKYDLPATANPHPGQKFRYVYHCHILEHEENEMMRPYDVVG
ncbi:MAG TPA: multicopper oxidase [Burkholderiales bacterium]